MEWLEGHVPGSLAGGIWHGDLWELTSDNFQSAWLPASQEPDTLRHNNEIVFFSFILYVCFHSPFETASWHSADYQHTLCGFWTLIPGRNYPLYDGEWLRGGCPELAPLTGCSMKTPLRCWPSEKQWGCWSLWVMFLYGCNLAPPDPPLCSQWDTGAGEGGGGHQLIIFSPTRDVPVLIQCT